MKIDLIYSEVMGSKTYSRRPLGSIEGIMMHRVGKDRATGVDFGDTAEEICLEFTEGLAKSAVGGKVPYTFIAEADGRIAQTLPLSLIGPHALKLSATWLSVALVGDFRYDEPPDVQFLSTMFLLRALLGTLALGVTAIKGHTDPEMVAAGSTRNKRKECPGKFLDLYKLSSCVTGGFAL